jgi:hypothetical protein
VQLEIDRPLGRPDAADVIPHNRHTTAISLLVQTLEDLLSAIRVGVQQPRDARLEGINVETFPDAGPQEEGTAATDRPYGRSGTGALARRWLELTRVVTWIDFRLIF